MDALKLYLTLLFGAVVAGLVLSNPRGTEAILNGFASFSAQTVSSFAGFSRG